MAPIIFLDSYFEAYQNETSFSQILEDVLATYKKAKNASCTNAEQLFSFEANKDKIVYRLVNYKLNKEALKERPHIPYLDLAIVFDILVEATDKGMASIPIQYKLLELWEKNSNEIYGLAKKNTKRELPVQLQYNTYDGPFGNLSISFYILSNNPHQNGAACILYDDVLNTLGEALQENFYVIPSSIHETLIISEHDAKGMSLSDMIQAVNEMAVLDTEILSDHPYYYNRKTLSLTCAM